MNGVRGNLLNGLLEIWRNIGVAQKVSIILILLVSAGVIGGILYMGSRPDWRILYANMDAKTAAKICDIVKDNNVAAKLTDGGRTILVPSKDVYNMRMKVASAGVQVDNKGTGLELFDNMQLGLTDRQQQVAYQRAIQGELQRMITEMPAVADAKIMITMPARSVFKKDSGRPSASVLLVMNRGAYLSPDQVNSIRYMVSSAVPGMTPDDVTITDNLGRLLRRQVLEGSGGGSGADAGSRNEFRTAVETDLKEKAESILRPIVGADKVVAVVSCDIDFDDVDRVVESVNTEQTAVVSEKMITDDASKSGTGKSGGPAGAAANAASRDVSVSNPEQPDQPKLMSEQRKTVERQFVVPKSMEKVSSKGGRVRKLTVAVTVGQKDDGKAWSTDDMAAFEKLVAAAVGTANYKYERTERPVTVQQLPFIKPADLQKTSIPVTDRIMEELEKLGSSGVVRPVAGILILLVLYGVFRKYFARQQVEGAELTSSIGEELYNSEKADGEVKQLGPDGAAAQAKAIETASESLQNKVKATPQSIAEFMENWLAQG